MSSNNISDTQDNFAVFREQQEKEWGLQSFNRTIFDNNRLARVTSKISPDGIIQNFQGVTSVFPILYTNISTQLASLSNEIYVEIEKAGLSHLVYQLPPSTHHMTIVDIAPNEIFNPEKMPGVPIPESLVQRYKENIMTAYDQISKEKITEITGQIKGIGANVTIAFRVDFQPEEYFKIIKIEKIIKHSTGIDIRSFPGIISAFLMKPNSELSERSKELINLLKQFDNLEDRKIMVTFSDLYYTLFRNMIDYEWLYKVGLLPKS